MKEKLLIALFSLGLVSIATIAFGTTCAAYINYRSVSQSVGVNGSRYLYLRPKSTTWDWTEADAKFYMYSWEGTIEQKGSAANYEFTEWIHGESFGEGNDYTLPFAIPAYANFCFLRAKSDKTLSNLRSNRTKGITHVNDGGYLWNWAEDLTLGTDNNNLFVITSAGGTSKSVYTPS